MKVILTEDVPNLGSSHDVVDVADGFARNFLMPRQMALRADRSALANLENMKRVEDRRQDRMRGVAEAAAAKLDGARIKIEVKSGAEGRLYGSINNADVAQQINREYELHLERKQVMLPQPIRLVGKYEIQLNLHRDFKPNVTLLVGDEDFDAIEAAAADKAAREEAELDAAEADFRASVAAAEAAAASAAANSDGADGGAPEADAPTAEAAASPS